MDHTPKRGTCDDCEVNWDRKGNVRTVVLCPLHAAAPALLSALEEIEDHAEEAGPYDDELKEGLIDIGKIAHAAILAAKGD